MEEIKDAVVDKVAEAKAIIEAEEKSKQEAFAKEINEVCEKHGYNLNVQSNIIIVKK